MSVNLVVTSYMPMPHASVCRYPHRGGQDGKGAAVGHGSGVVRVDASPKIRDGAPMVAAFNAGQGVRLDADPPTTLIRLSSPAVDQPHHRNH